MAYEQGNLRDEAAQPLVRFAVLREQGASPREIYLRAQQESMGQIEAIRLLRQLFDLSLQEAKAVADDRPAAPPPVESYAELRQTLTRELGYCVCASDDAVPVLADILQLAQDRAATTADTQAFTQASGAVEERLWLNTASGIASWFVYALEQRDLIWHGSRLTDIWITDKGRTLLEALRRFHPQAQGDDVIEARVQGGAREVLSWLQEEPGRYRSVSGCEPPEAQALVQSFYEAGARRVMALDIVTDTDEEEMPFEYTGTLAIQLPEQAQERQRILSLCASFARCDAEVPDRGRRWVLLWDNSGRPVVCF